MSSRIDFRAPKGYKEKCLDIARNRRITVAQVYREALESYLSGYSTIPSLKELDNQVQVIQRKLNEVERALLRKGLM